MGALGFIRELQSELIRIAPWWADFSKPLSAAQVAAFEALHEICLPEEFRSFLLEIGDRAPIPGQARGGVLPLAEALSATTATDFLGPLSRSFPHCGDAEVSLAWDEELDEYCEQPPLGGLLPIADGGCDVTHHLVITGEDRGRVWMFAPSGDPELEPLGQGFLDWYRYRLERGMTSLRRAEQERRSWEERLETDPEDLEAMVALGRRLLLLETERASALLEAAWALEPRGGEDGRVERLRAIAELDLVQGREDRIASMSQEEDPLVRAYVGIAAAQRGRWSEVEEIFSATQLPYGIRSLACAYHGQALMERNELEAAVNILRAAPSSRYTYSLLAKLYALQGETERALRALLHLEQSLEKHPQWQPQSPSLVAQLEPGPPSRAEIAASRALLDASRV